MTVVVCGLATVGAAMAAWLLERGQHVIGVDTDPLKRQAAAAGQGPANEPGIGEAFAKGVDSGRFSVVADLTEVMALPTVETLAIAVGTPGNVGGGLSLEQLLAATDAAAAGILARPQGSPRPLICYRSTMPPGTCRDTLLPRLEALLGRVGERFELVYHPEFLRMGHALQDARNPSRIVLGERFPGASRRLNGLYGNARGQIIELDFASAELAKMIDNTWRATKVAFANETARLAIASGADSAGVLRVLTADTEHNLSATYLRPGLPYGGYCLPKDSAGVAEAARAWGVDAPLFAAVPSSNGAHADALASGIASGFPAGASLLLVGLGFKPGSSDLRDSPLLDLADRLLDEGFRLAIHDPAFPDSSSWPDRLKPCWRPEPHAADAEAVVLGHPWPKAAARPLVPVIDLTHLTSLSATLP